MKPKKCLITGATGYIGNRLVHKLLENGYEVNVLARSREKFAKLYKNEVIFFEGDLWDKKVIDEATQQCEAVFHLAALADIWSKDKQLPWKTNVLGTFNVLEAAFKNQVKKVVYTSSAAVFPPSVKNEILDETALLPDFYLTDYETTKKQAEQVCLDYVKKGLNVVIVNPTRVFGPGILSKSNSTTLLIKKYIEGKWRFIPATGDSIGNYVFVDDVVNGHILAMIKGIPGEKYILGGTNLTFVQFFQTISETSGKSFKMYHLPYSLMLGFATSEFFLAETLGKKPVITPPWVKRYLQNRPLSICKAQEVLGYRITPVQEALLATINWLKV